MAGGEHAILRRFLERQAAAETAAADWCYVHNFSDPHKPVAIALPHGRGLPFKNDMSRLVEELCTSITTALESDEYRQRHQQLHDEFNARRETTFEDLRQRAAQRGVAVLQTPMGLALAPMANGEVLAPEEFERLSEEQKAAPRAATMDFEHELEQIMHEVPKWRRDTHDKLRSLRQGVISAAVDALIDELTKKYADVERIQVFLAALEKDVIENADDFRKEKEDEENPLEALMSRARDAQQTLGRYQVNVLGRHENDSGAPVVYEDRPTFQNLVGRIKHVSQMGTLTTDFTHIKAGALHKANGGYLLLDARRVLVEPFAWDGLKRALRGHSIRIESLGEALSLVNTVSLDPEPIPLNVKVVLLGDPRAYYLLYDLDPDFRELFKVAVDFESDVDRTTSTSAEFARLLGSLLKRETLRPLSAAGVARVIEESARRAGDASKLSIQLDQLVDLLREADHWAASNGHAAVEGADVQRAIDAKTRRESRLRDRMRETIERSTISISTTGGTTGQVNALSVIDLGGFAFALPSRITARIRLGGGKVVDIEREVELSGPIHSKGVLILAGFIAGRYVVNEPLSLAASLVFEQQYGGVEGDSASSAELYALLSALADVPVRQSIAVTGSVNQRGEMQAVGAVSEKIEGFFDICNARGLTGEQGVLIPRSNVTHLMLRDDVVAAVEAGRFHVYAADSIDEGVEILTGCAAGARDATGTFPSGSFNYRVKARLLDFARRAIRFVTPAAGVVSPHEAA
ncbi:MAG TPA: ATP-binding protein [Vicinamibacterales bacterium]|nr:ATP-binding protein [Vicinamibacterales bacterium]